MNNLLFKKGMRPVWLDQTSAADGIWQPIKEFLLVEESSTRPGTPKEESFSIMF